MPIKINRSKTNNNGKDTNEERRSLLNLKGEVDLVCNLDWNPIQDSKWKLKPRIAFVPNGPWHHTKHSPAIKLKVANI